MPVTIDAVRIIFRAHFPKLITDSHYKRPQFHPSKWALLDGPFYGDSGSKGSLLIDLSEMQNWSIKVAKNSWTNQSAEQEAKEYFSEWLKKIDLNEERVTILDREQRAFLQNYRTDFVDNNWHQIYCPQCKIAYKVFNRQRLNQKEKGKKLSWTLEWTCILGHLLYRQDDSIRLF